MTASLRAPVECHHSRSLAAFLEGRSGMARSPVARKGGARGSDCAGDSPPVADETGRSGSHDKRRVIWPIVRTGQRKLVAFQQHAPDDLDLVVGEGKPDATVLTAPKPDQRVRC